jgi:hypothetical protein
LQLGFKKIGEIVTVFDFFFHEAIAMVIVIRVVDADRITALERKNVMSGKRKT